ncbi:MAG: hypothetical protein H6645_11060 [Caldilineaceae bacterium]|nr:hypothetical protein [Caldilineaceae bacterium]
MMTTHAYRRTKRQRIGNTIMALLAAMLFTAACPAPTPIPCLPEPTEDPSPPSVLMVVHYRSNGIETIRSVTEHDENVMIRVDNANEVRVVYIGSDSEGMKKLQPSVEVTWGSDGLQHKENWTIQATVATCPRGKIQDQITFAEVVTSATIKMTVTATNWLGGQTSTERITIAGPS